VLFFHLDLECGPSLFAKFLLLLSREEKEFSRMFFDNVLFFTFLLPSLPLKEQPPWRNGAKVIHAGLWRSVQTQQTLTTGTGKKKPKSFPF